MLNGSLRSLRVGEGAGRNARVCSELCLTDEFTGTGGDAKGEGVYRRRHNLHLHMLATFRNVRILLRSHLLYQFY